MASLSRKQALCFLMLCLLSLRIPSVSATSINDSERFSVTNGSGSTAGAGGNIFLRSSAMRIAEKEAERNNAHIDATNNKTIKNQRALTSQGQKTAKRSFPQHRFLQGGGDYGEYFNDLDIDTLGEGMAMGGGLMLIIIILCLLCCCCQMCCGGRRGGGGSCSLWDILALFCCYEMFCDESPCIFNAMDDGALC